MLEMMADTMSRFHLRHRDQQPLTVAMHAHPFYEIFYFHKGRCRYLIGDRIYDLAPGNVILMHGMTLHCANVDPDEEYVRTVIHFTPSYIEGAVHFPHALDLLNPFRKLKNVCLPLNPEQQTEFEQLLARLDRLQAAKDPISYNRLHLAFLDLLTVLYGYAEERLKIADEHKYPEKMRGAQSIIAYLERHYMDDVHLDDLERELHLSKHYMAKIFKETTGITIFTYLYTKRINESKILLITHPEMKITDIGYRVGFKHPAHFSRVFRQQTGCTPEQFRKQEVWT
ncbi:helix-turn-helix transcriptional regulator [Xylanibacillus composti]|uniref:AraC family transcriptional regulator n=1 Tax=Xylanibacillus composti TaxID=1572762 RepID=A0A8J4H0T2_9BACL|nr:AraC family transcriptional regulator [Xylanibacillus composti]GIQ68837.1 AraC family transcriptional regulator [Xylanibacillus composti]